jgi:hypothetical protein
MPTMPARPRARFGRFVRIGAAAGLALTLGLTARGGPDGLEGTVLKAPTGAGSSAPYAGGWVASFTPDQLVTFWYDAGIDPPADPELPVAEGRVSHDGVSRTGGRLAPVDDAGRFSLTGATGVHVVCLLREAGQVDLLRGCASLTLPAQGRLTLTSGPNGLRARLDD